MNSQFTVQHGFTQQRNELTQWKFRLSAVCFEALQDKCRKENYEILRRLAATGHDVFRGQQLTEFVANWHSNK